jgi:hypothetical protein
MSMLYDKGFNPKIPYCRPKKEKQKDLEENENVNWLEKDDFDLKVRLSVDQTSANRQATKVQLKNEKHQISNCLKLKLFIYYYIKVSFHCRKKNWRNKKSHSLG